MATTILELTAEIVISHVSVTEMSPDQLVKEIEKVYRTLQSLEESKPSAIATSIQEPQKRGRKPRELPEAPKGPAALPQLAVKPEPATLPAGKAQEKPAAAPAPVMTIEEAFKADQVGCMICGKTGMKTLKRHLGTAHNLKPAQYRKQFNIPRDQPLAATEYIEKRRQVAIDRGLAEKLVKARAARKSQ